MNLGVLEAKNRLSELIDRVLAGERVVITRRGEPQVELAPLRRRPSDAEIDRLMEDARRLRARYKGPKRTASDTRRDRDEGRR